MTESTRSLPPHPSLEQQKKLAKDLLQAFRAGDAEAVERIRRHLPDRARVTLADAQFALAREYGFASWPKLRAHIEASRRSEVAGDDAIAAFRRAVNARDAAAVRTLLQRHAAVRAVIDAPLFSFDTPALVHVADPDNLPLVEVLLEYGASPNRRSDWWAGGWHALHSARGALADRLIEAGAVPDACAAANLDRPELLRRMLTEEPARVHERGGDGQTPLHFARSREVIDLLLQHGADPDARDVDHRATPAQWMLDRRRGAGRYALARYLVERGATPDIFLAAALGLTTHLHALLAADPALLSCRTAEGDYGEQPPSSHHIYTWTIGQNLSPLQVAAQFEQHEALQVLRSFAGPKELFLTACSEARADEAKRLLREQPRLLEELSESEQGALANAGWGANTAAVALMLELGFDPAIQSQRGTVLHAAAWEGSVACVEAALRYPAVRTLVNERDRLYGGTPLGWCCHGAAHCGNPQADHAAVARLLLEAGTIPDMNLEDVRADIRAVIAAYQGARS